MRSERRFRFGAVGRSGQEWAATARHIEELGFATLLCPDGTGTLAPFQALSAAAAATRTLRLGSYVLAAPLRTPAEVAWETATLDVLSEGRFELGLGAGRPAAASDAALLGLPFGTPSERVSRVQQTIEAVRARYAASDAHPGMTPCAACGPGPPVLVAGTGPRMLDIAAQEAATLALGLPPHSTEDDLAAKADQVRAIAGPGFDRLELNVNIALVGDSRPMPPHGSARIPRRCSATARSPCSPAPPGRWPTRCCDGATAARCPTSRSTPSSPTRSLR